MNWRGEHKVSYSRNHNIKSSVFYYPSTPFGESIRGHYLDLDVNSMSAWKQLERQLVQRWLNKQNVELGYISIRQEKDSHFPLFLL